MGGSAMMAKGGCAVFRKLLGSSFGDFEWYSDPPYSTTLRYMVSTETNAYFIRSLFTPNIKVIIYDFATHTWDTSSGATCSIQVGQGGYILHENRIYMQQNASPCRTIWYDISSNTWDITSGAIAPIGGFGIAVHNGFQNKYGDLLIGYDDTAFAYGYQVYDTINSTWTKIGEPYADVEGSGSSNFFNPIIIGHKMYNTWWIPNSEGEGLPHQQMIYDFNTQEWSVSETLPHTDGVARYKAVYGDLMYFIISTGGVYPNWTAVLSFYDTSSDTWTTTGFSPLPLTVNLNISPTPSFSSTTLYFAHGTNPQYQKFLYDTLTDTWDIRDTSDIQWTYLGNTTDKEFIWISNPNKFEEYFGRNPAPVRENILAHKTSISSVMRDKAAFWKLGETLYQIWEYPYPNSPVYTKDYAFQFIATFPSTDPMLFVSHYPWSYISYGVPNTRTLTSTMGFIYTLTAGLWVQYKEFTSIDNTYDIVSGTIILANNGIGQMVR